MSKFMDDFNKALSSFSQGAKDYAFGTPARVEQLSRLSPQQLQSQNQILQSFTPEVLNQNLRYDPIRKESTHQFLTQQLPMINEKWASGGSGRPSRITESARADALARFNSLQDANESQFNLQKQGYLNNLLGTAMNPSMENIYHPRQAGAFEINAPEALKQVLSSLTQGNQEGEPDQATWEKIAPAIVQGIGGLILGQPGAQFGKWFGNRFNDAFKWTGGHIYNFVSNIVNRLRGINSSGQQSISAAPSVPQLTSYTDYLNNNVKR